MRNLTKTLAVVSLLVPASGHTLGIGEIKLHSALNQNLDAEISLTLSGESVSDIKVHLAPPEKFDEAGVSWIYFLSKIKFETITYPNGSAVIKLTSTEALKEPFLDFLLEVSWPKGNLYREFTVLVDPPSVYNQATIPVSTSTESYAQPLVPTQQRQSYVNGQNSEGEYGPTLANDTLWSVAERARGQDDISVEQMMIAIYQANPNAFYKGNVHALTAGKMLAIPEREAVLKLSRNQALAEFNRQTKAWKSHSASTHVEAAKEKPALNRVEGSIDNQLTLIAPAKTTVEDRAVVASEHEPVRAEKKTADLSSVTPEIVKGKPVPSVAEGIEQGASAVELADGAIQSKVAELEKQLAMMQQLIALKDQQLAALQNQSKANSVVKEQALPGEVVAAKPAEHIIPVPPQAVDQPVKSVQPVQPVAQPEPGTGDLYYLGVSGAGAAILTLLGWLWWRKRKVDEQTNTESMFASSSIMKTPEVDENLSVPVVEEGAAVVHDVGTVGESSFLSEFTPSDFDSFDTDQGEIDPISEADVYLAYGRYQQAEELIRQAIIDQPNRDECKLKLLEIFYANEDKVAFEVYANELAEAGKRNEAEFWEKAAEMGREICPGSPLFSSEGRSFVDEQRINEDIDFDLSSFSMNTKDSGEAEQGVIATGTEAGKSSGTQEKNIDFDLSSFSMDSKESDEAEQGVIAASTQADKSSGTQADNLDFDLSPFSMDIKEPDEAEQGVIASSAQTGRSSGTQANNIDFDLSSFSMDAKESDEVNNGFTAPGALSGISSGTNGVNKKQEFESYEFDFSSNHAEKAGIDALDFSALENSDKSHQNVDFSADRSLDLNDDLNGDFDFNFDLDLDMPVTTSGQSFSQHDEIGVSDLTDMDELETKLDLAKAYVDMGDADAAKDLAREVLEQGTAEQKKVAQALLDELD